MSIALCITHVSMLAQSVTTASSSMTISPWAVRIPYNIADEGKEFTFTAGMGGWSDPKFAYQQRNWVGREYINIARVGFFGRNSTSATVATELAPEQISGGIDFTFPNGDGKVEHHNGIEQELAAIAETGAKNLILLCDMDMRVRLSASDWNNANRRKYYVNDIALAVQYIESKGYKVIAVSPFNEPDYNALQNCGKSATVFNNVAAEMQNNPILKGRVCGPNTLNSTEGKSWYNTIKNNIDFINTHQLAGNSLSDFVSFWDTGVSGGKQALADEMHNVMEAMVAMNHGARWGTWWAYDGVARAEFARMTSLGKQIAYKEDNDKWAVGGVYRYNTDNGKAKAIIGTSERQAVATSFTLLSKGRLAYYDGYGPLYDYGQDVPGGAKGSYQNGQTNAERVININTGEDVPVEAINGKYKIVNKASGKVLSTLGGSLFDAVRISQYADGGVGNQSWDIAPVAMTIGGDYSYHYITNSNTNDKTYHLDDLDWSLDENKEVIAYPGGGSGCEQWHIRYVADGYYTIINRHSGLCLAVRDGNLGDGANVVQMKVNESAAQLWKFVPATSTVDAVAPTVPSGLTAAALAGAVKLSWTPNKEKDILGYMVYRYNDVAKIWECVGRKVKTATFIDNTCRKGQPLRYRVKAIDGAYNLSAASNEIITQTSSINEIVGQWTGLSFKDNTSNKLHALANGVTSTTDSNRPAFSFDGTDDYMKLPYHVGDMQSMTFAAWVKGGSTTAWQRIFDFGNGEDEYLFLTPTNGSVMRFEIKKNGIVQGLDATTTLGTGSWKHVAVTIGSNGVVIYINGEKNASTTDITLRPSDVIPTMSYLGRSQFDADPAFKGMMSDVRIYNYALSADEVKNLTSVTVSTSGYDVTAERIPNIADNVNNWTVTGSWTTHTSSADGSGLAVPYVRIGKSGTSKISKTLNYIPEGTYTLSVSCMSYYKSIWERDVTGVTLFANDATTTVNTKSNKAAKTLIVQTNLSGTNSLEFGINADNTNKATILAMDNVKLVYQGSVTDYIEGIENLTYNEISEAQSLLLKPMNSTAVAALQAALNNVDNKTGTYTNKVVAGTATPADVEAWIKAFEELEKPVAYALASIEEYRQLGALISTAHTKAAANPRTYGNEAFESELAVIENKYNTGGYAESEIPAAVIELKGILNRYLLADAKVLATDENPIDVTALVVGDAGFDNESFASWTTSPNPSMAYGSAEFWNKNYNIYQTLYGMPAGTYRLQTRGFYRYGYQPDNVTARDNGTLQRNAKLYISHSGGMTATADVMAISDDPSNVHLWGAWYSEGYQTDYAVPDNMQAASEAIDVRGRYLPKNGYNTVDITVTERGDLTIGARKDVLVGGDWSFFGDFTLYYLGDGENELVLNESDNVLPTIDETVVYDKVTVNRTLNAGKDGGYGNWNTFVLPFDMEIPEGWQVKELTGSTVNGDVISMEFDNAETIKAGVPYMVRVLSNVKDIVSENVEVTTTPANVKTDHVEFVGVCKSGYVPQGAFFISSNLFYRAAKANNNKIKAFRAYITPLETNAEAKSLNYSFDDDDDINGIEEAINEVTVEAIYTLDGKRIADMQQGVNILKMSDGRTVKVVIK